VPLPVACGQHVVLPELGEAAADTLHCHIAFIRPVVVDWDEGSRGPLPRRTVMYAEGPLTRAAVDGGRVAHVFLALTLARRFDTLRTSHSRCCLSYTTRRSKRSLAPTKLLSRRGL
jgi:hypothetical protein